MGIFDFFKKKDNSKKNNIKTTTNTYSTSTNKSYLKIDLEDADKILRDYIKGKPGSEKRCYELQNKLKEYEVKSKLEKQILEEYYSKFMNAKSLEKDGKIDEALSIYMDIINNYNPEGVSYYERPAIMLEKVGDYKRALSIAMLGKQNLINQSLTTTNIDISYFDKRIFRLEDKIKNPPKPKSTKKIVPKNVQVSVPSLHKSKNELSTQVSSWNISISFGKSTSSNYAKAVFLAKQSSNYYEEGEGKNIIHQATYTSAPADYLAFIALYELVGSWKSSFVFINGQLIDRKIIGKLNYCYGDKCRSGNNKFCYGASEYTLNPFGCHRLQISECNNPWWTFGMLDTKKIWHVDKKAILERINEKCIPYKNCPNFSYDKIIFNLNKLPDTIYPKKDKNWEYRDGAICPKDYGVVARLTIKIED